jgi:hypothetical protein
LKLKTISIDITSADKKKCANFAEASVDSSLSHYRKRNNTTRERVVDDIITGKLGEIGAYRYLKSMGFDATEPDFKVYEQRHKTFDADISDMTHGFKFHCKAQSENSAIRYGNSWILQYAGKGWGHQDKLFKHRSERDFLIPLLVLDEIVVIFGIVKINTIFENNMIEEPAIPWFKDTKRAIYLDKLATLPLHDRWGILKKVG